MRRAAAYALCTPAGASARRSNREIQLLESTLSCSKQTALDSPNREKTEVHFAAQLGSGPSSGPGTARSC